MDFQQRLQKAVERGQRHRDSKLDEAAAKAISEEEYRRLHSQYRLQLSEHAEECLKQLVDQFPGFRFESLVGERGWGAAVSRDDVDLRGTGSRANLYSRLEIVVRPLGKYHVLDLAAKGTIRNKEAYSRNHFQPLDEVDLDGYRELIDLWVLEYAEMYAASD